MSETDAATSSASMKTEIDAAVLFLSQFLVRAHFEDAEIARFAAAFRRTLVDFYEGHWYPTAPSRGSGYRCIRCNGKMDVLLIRSADAAMIDRQRLRAAFPAELTVWIDPAEVCYRFGEDGSICALPLDASAVQTSPERRTVRKVLMSPPRSVVEAPQQRVAPVPTPSVPVVRRSPSPPQSFFQPAHPQPGMFVGSPPQRQAPSDVRVQRRHQQVPSPFFMPHFQQQQMQQRQQPTPPYYYMAGGQQQQSRRVVNASSPYAMEQARQMSAVFLHGGSHGAGQACQAESFDRLSMATTLPLVSTLGSA